VLADVGDVSRFADRNRFAPWTGTAPVDAGRAAPAPSPEPGTRRMDHLIHIVAISQIRLDTDGRQASPSSHQPDYTLLLSPAPRSMMPLMEIGGIDIEGADDGRGTDQPLTQSNSR